MSVFNSFYNDSAYVFVYLIIAFFSLVILGVSIYFHELGHWLYFKYHLHKNIKLRFQFNHITSFKWLAGEEKDYKNLTKKQYINLTLVGILCGMLPILVISYTYIFFIFILLPYLVGCRSDISELIKHTKILDKIEE